MQTKEAYCVRSTVPPTAPMTRRTWVVLQQAVTSTGASSASIGLQAAVTIPAEKAVLEVTCASIPWTAGPASRVFARCRQLDAISVDVLATTTG
ncbi:MAG: hypothetical protein LH654_01630 [Thermoleophilia bacterium]|nr:hypothetical protein [Thermoleophilia bacterium]